MLLFLSLKNVPQLNKLQSPESPPPPRSVGLVLLLAELNSLLGPGDHCVCRGISGGRGSAQWRLWVGRPCCLSRLAVPCPGDTALHLVDRKVTPRVCPYLGVWGTHGHFVREGDGKQLACSACVPQLDLGVQTAEP